MYVCHPYEDPELVREMFRQEAIEELEMKSQKVSIIPAGFEGVVAAMAAKANEAKPQKVQKARATLLDTAKAEVAAGKLPQPVAITSQANPSYNRHIYVLFTLAQEGNAEDVKAYVVKGTNTYSKVVAGYKGLLIEYLEKAKAEALSSTVSAKPKAMVKKIATAKPATAKTASAKPTKPKGSTATTAKARKAPRKHK